MTFLYVLVSSPKDTYYEQFLVSITSLIIKNPDAKIIVLCDEKTGENLTDKRREHEKIVSETRVVKVHNNLSQKEISRWIKTSMINYIDGDFIFIDCDTVIANDLRDLNSENIVLGAVLDKHLLVEHHYKRSHIEFYDKKLGFHSAKTNRHFNSGFIFCRDNADTRRFFNRWHELWRISGSKNILSDQPSFNQAICENPCLVTEMNGIWNCQIAYNGLPFLHNAKVIHYFASSLITRTPPFLLARESVFQSIKENGFIPDDVMSFLKNPLAAFDPASRIIAGDSDLDAVNSDFFSLLILFRRKYPPLFKQLDKFLTHIKIILSGRK
jgi:hypothetical protein